MYYKLYTNLDAQGGLPLMQAAEQGAKIYVPEGSVLILTWLGCQRPYSNQEDDKSYLHSSNIQQIVKN